MVCQHVSILYGSQAHVGGHVPGQVLVTLVQELNSHRDGQLHDRLLVIVEEDTGHDVTCHLGMGWVSSARGTETVRQTGLQQGDEGAGMLLDGSCLPDSRDDPGHADLHQGLVIVTGQELRLTRNILYNIDL